MKTPFCSGEWSAALLGWVGRQCGYRRSAQVHADLHLQPHLPMLPSVLKAPTLQPSQTLHLFRQSMFPSPSGLLHMRTPLLGMPVTHLWIWPIPNILQNSVYVSFPLGHLLGFPNAPILCSPNTFHPYPSTALIIFLYVLSLLQWVVLPALILQGWECTLRRQEIILFIFVPQHPALLLCLIQRTLSYLLRKCTNE